MSDHFPTVRTRRPEPLSVLWSLLSAPQTLMILLACVALSLILGELVPQIPPQARGDPAAWLALQPELSGGKLWLVRAFALYDVYHTFWFRALIVLTGLVLLVRLADTAELAWRSTGRKHWTWSNVSRGSGRQATSNISSSLRPDEILARVRELLEERGYRWNLRHDELVSILVAVRREFLLWAQPLGYGAMLLALAGLAILDSVGWEAGDWQPVMGETRAVGRGTPFTVRMDRFELEWGPDGRLRGTYAEITWLDGDMDIESARIREGAPSTHHGISVGLGGYVPAVRIRGRDEAGRALVFQKPGDVVASPGETTIVFPTADAQPLLLLPAEDLLLVLSFDPQGAEGKPALHLAIPPGEPETEQVVEILHDSGQVSLKGLQLEVDLSYRPILRIDYHPGVTLILTGLILTLAVLMVTWLVPGRLFWIILPPLETGLDDEGLHPSGDGTAIVRVLTPSAAEWTRWRLSLIEDLSRALTNGD